MKSPVRIRINQLKIVIFYIATIIGCFVLPAKLEIILCGFFVIYLMIEGNNAIAGKDGNEMAFLLIFPVLLSCIQNIYLGFAVKHLHVFELQILLTINIIIAAALPAMRIVMTRTLYEHKWCIVCIGGTLLYSFVLFIANRVPISSFISSMRNILAPFVFFYFGAVFGKNIDEKSFKKYLVLLINFVVFFGLFEYFVGNGFWQTANISQLWNLKGIVTAPDEFPSNWFSSEVIFGHPYVRRMVSSFADPVNLGTFLFAAFMLSWYYKKYVLMLLTILCCIFTISKGALLGFLIFCVVIFWYKEKSKIGLAAAFAGALVIGIAMLKYGAGSSTGLHVLMFLRALRVPFQYPMGMGVGTIGVLSGITGGNTTDLYIMETGIGVVIAQLGFWGVALYVYLFYKMMMIPRHMTKNKRVFLYTLIFSFFANAMFNEVALSPNSCALYFIILGIWDAREKNMLTSSTEVEINENTYLHA